MKKKRIALLNSVLALLLCVAMLAGSTFAWFTDEVVSTGNIIKSGTLDLEVYWAEDLNSGWNDVENVGTNKIFDYKYWEPGYTQVRYIKIVNAGNLAFRYALEIKPNGEVSELADVIDVYAAEAIDGRADLTNPVGTLRDVISGDITAKGELIEGEVILAIALKMREDAGNEYQNLSIGDSFGITLSATQYTYEEDSFGSDYDTDAQFPSLKGDATGSATVETENGATTGDTTITTNTDVTAEVPAGVKVEDGTETLELTVSNGISRSDNISMVTGEVSRSFDVHISGVAEDNTVPMIINLGAILPAGMKTANVRLVHVENGVPVEMEQTDNLTAHNQFFYEAATGEVTVCMASFSEVTAVVAVNDPWDGTYDYSWYTDVTTVAEGDPDYTISSAEQFAAFGAIVGGMAAGIEQDTFADKTITLTADLDLGGQQGKVWYPIGYYNSTGSYEKVSGGSVTSDVYSFEGTFDGQGHTISNIYQNTWDMFGDYNDGYSGTPNHYDDGMGIFGFVFNGTVKNLTVSNFQSDGEFCTTGVVAAYASGDSTFENITILKSNPRAYNVPNGGVVGYAYAEGSAEKNEINFNNVTVDSSNKITALWGSWDVGCGGILGRVNGATTVNMTNCEVGAVIDVFNDVCANYQYYQYRYSGMLIGTVGGDGDPKSGAETVNFSNVTVYIGDWADYYYCEFEKNSGASYTEDFQFSRVERNEIEFDENNMPTKCTHTHTPNEDRLAYYLPFNQLYTGYGWGASPVYANNDVYTENQVKIVQYFYMITYMNAEGTEVIDVEYVTAGQSDATHNVAAAKKIDKTHSEGSKEFDGWINAGSTKITEIARGNRKDVVLYVDWADEHIATFVDNEGNVLYKAAFTKNGFKNGFVPADPPDAEGGFKGTWEYDLSKAKGDITIMPVYSLENAQIKLLPVDSDGDGITNEYHVTGVDQNGNKDVDIPAYLNGIPITQIQDGAFADFSEIRDIDIPNTIEYLGADAFADEEKSWGQYHYETIQIFFDGTKAEWEALIAKSDANWDRYVGISSVVVCKAEDPAGYYQLEGKYSSFLSGSKKENDQWVWVNGEYERPSYNENSGS